MFSLRASRPNCFVNKISVFLALQGAVLLTYFHGVICIFLDAKILLSPAVKYVSEFEWFVAEEFIQ